MNCRNQDIKIILVDVFMECKYNKQCPIATTREGQWVTQDGVNITLQLKKCGADRK